VAGAAASWMMRSLLKQEFRSQELDTHETENSDTNLSDRTDPQGIHFVETEYFEVAGLTDAGKRRSNNQDSFRLGRATLAHEDQVLAVVCDGMGGHAGGEVASQIASDIIWTVVSKQAVGNDERLHQCMAEALERADTAIEQRASKERDLEGMGTTAVMAAVNRDKYVHSYIGDSRLYHWRDGAFIYQTRDHSLVRYLVEEGVIGANEAKEHPYRSQLTSSLGGGPNSNRLTIEPKWDSKDHPMRDWVSGDWLVLCSDGLNSELDDDEIAQVVSDCDNAKQAVLALRDKVLETEARDNVTVVVARKF
jgi:PPM family protein phosphatase